MDIFQDGVTQLFSEIVLVYTFIPPHLQRNNIKNPYPYLFTETRWKKHRIFLNFLIYLHFYSMEIVSQLLP